MTKRNSDKPVQAPRENLQRDIVQQELPNVICRCLRAYDNLRSEVTAAGGGFWRVAPRSILDWQSKLASATNKLHAFLTMDEDERGYRIERVEGHVTWMFKQIFQSHLSGSSTFPATAKPDVDLSVLTTFGFTVSTDPHEKVCLACKQIAKARGGKCCAEYSQGNRRKKEVIYNMQVTPLLTPLSREISL
jgi:hypothetical protein